MLVALDTPDYGWICDQLGPLLHEIYRSPDPNAFIKSMDDWRQNFYFAATAMQYIINGGVESYLESRHGDEVDSLLNALEVIGAKEFRKLIISLKRLFPEEEIPVEIEERIKCMDRIERDNEVERISELLEGGIDDNICALIRGLEPSE